MTGDFAAAAQASALLTHVVTRHGVTLWKSMARCLEGEVLIKRGDAVAGTIVLGQERDSFVKTWRMTRLPEILCILAEGLAAIGQGSAARATVDEALARSEQDGQRWCVPELRRVRGELLLQQGGQDDAAAEADFMAAIAEARLQGALFWELRAALSLARLRLRHDRGDEARACLAPVCARFTEGFATADLRDALALLDALPPGRAVGEAEGVRPG
jgi:predicted ATPase